jgi:hypothetical protein
MNEPKRIAQIVGKWVGGGVEAVIMNYYRNIDKSKIQFDFLCDEDSTNIPSSVYFATAFEGEYSTYSNLHL